MNPPKKSLGQNFLQDENIARKIVALVDKSRPVLEIGAGRGALTRFLLEQGVSLTVLEKDCLLVSFLREEFASLEVICADALQFDWESVQNQVIIGNLPYNVASPIIWEVVSRSTFCQAVFMVQKEVAERICACPGKKAYGALSVWVQAFAQVEYAFTVSPNVFFPRPKVDSAVVKFLPVVQKVDRKALKNVLALLFRQRRKQIGGLLKPFWNKDFDAWLERCGLSRQSRAENISPQHFLLLSELLRKK